VFKGVGVEA